MFRWVCDYHKDCEHGEDEHNSCRKFKVSPLKVMLLVTKSTITRFSVISSGLADRVGVKVSVMQLVIPYDAGYEMKYLQY
jgi:hypothetical protein